MNAAGREAGAGQACRKRIYLMRHAAVAYFDGEGRPLDPRSVPLTEEGRAQATAAGRMLADIPFDLAVSSGLPRTIETAALVLAGRAIPLHEEPRFKEVRGGRLREIPADELEAAVAHAYDGAHHPGGSFIRGEAWATFAERVQAAWQHWLQRDFHHLLVVAHDAVNRVILAQACGAGLAGLSAFEQDPACVNVLDVDVLDGRVVRTLVRAVGITPYDLAKKGIRQTVMELIHETYRGSRT